MPNNWSVYSNWPIYPLLAATCTLPILSHQALLSATTSPYTHASPAHAESFSPYYPADFTNDRTQLAILERFAARLATETVETPQAAVDAINDRFWDLI